MGCATVLAKRSSTKHLSNGVISTGTLNTTVQASNIQTEIEKNTDLKNCDEEQPLEGDGIETLTTYQLLFDLGINCVEEFKLVAEINEAFWIHYSSFKSSVHGFCIPNYTLTKGLKVNFMFSSVFTTQNGNFIETKKKFPFFSVQNRAHFKEIKDLLYMVKYIHKSQEFIQGLLRIEYIIKSLQTIEVCDQAEYAQAVQILQRTARDGRSLLTLVKEISQEIKEVSIKLPSITRDVLVLQGIFKSFPECSPSEIVHFIYSNSNKTGITI